MHQPGDRYECKACRNRGARRGADRRQPDSVKSHAKFAGSLGLTFPILSDESLQAINAYGVFREKKMYGKSVMGIARTTFILDENGTIEKVFEKVKAAASADDVIAYLSGQGA
jgi:peroxiredoxin Q/BCP